MYRFAEPPLARSCFYPGERFSLEPANTSSPNVLKTASLIVDNCGWSYFCHLIDTFSTDQFDSSLQTASYSRGPSTQTMRVGADAGDQPFSEQRFGAGARRIALHTDEAPCCELR